MDQSEEMAKLRSIVEGNAGINKEQGVLLESADPANSELDALMKKYGVMEEGQCNMTAEGDECPVHGLEECGSYMEEAKKEKPDFLDVDGDGDKTEPMKKAVKDKEAKKVKENWDQKEFKKYMTDMGYRVGKIDRPNPMKLALVDKLAPSQRAQLQKFAKENPKASWEELDDFLHDALGYTTIKKMLRNPELIPDDSEHKPLFDLMRDRNLLEIDDTEKNIDESIHIEVDGAEAEMFINRMAELAGSPAHVGSDVHADVCPGCGCGMDQCTCDDDSCCDDCGEYNCQCGDDDLHAEVPMENADHDHGHAHHTPEGEPVDPATYTWEPERDPQRFVRSIGDNPLIKENADALYKKLKGDYKAYVAEAELARSNTGNDSPLTANNRDEFDKDPFKSDDAVTDGTHSPLSTIKRQDVAK